MATKIKFVWTSTKRGRIQHLYDQHNRVLGWIEREPSPLGPTYAVHHVVTNGPARRVAAMGGGFDDEAAGRARKFLEDVVRAAEAKAEAANG